MHKNDESNVDTYDDEDDDDDDDDDDAQSISKTAWLNVLEAVSTSCELTKDEIDANRSMLLQMLSSFKASRDFEPHCEACCICHE